MQSATPSLRKISADLLILFPALMMLAFAMHFRSVSTFFNFRLVRPPYNGGKLFDLLVTGHGHGFVMAHLVAFLTVPLFMITISILAWLLYPQKPWLAFTGATVGLLGCTGLAAVFGAWLTFADIHGLAPAYYAGARPAFIELVRMKGMLQLITVTSYLAFIGLAILAAGLGWTKQLKPIPACCMIGGALLFVAFMDMDNWMFVGSLLLLIGLYPVSKQLKQQ